MICNIWWFITHYKVLKRRKYLMLIAFFEDVLRRIYEFSFSRCWGIYRGLFGDHMDKLNEPRVKLLWFPMPPTYGVLEWRILSQSHLVDRYLSRSHCWFLSEEFYELKVTTKYRNMKPTLASASALKAFYVWDRK